MLEQSGDLVFGRIIEFDMNIKAAWSTECFVKLLEMIGGSEEDGVFLSNQLPPKTKQLTWLQIPSMALSRPESVTVEFMTTFLVPSLPILYFGASSGMSLFGKTQSLQA
jgi:hypothetical protein